MASFIYDHLPQFIVTVTKGLLENIYILNLETIIEYTDFRNCSVDDFKQDIDGMDWSLVTDNKNVDLGFESSLNIFNRISKKHASRNESSQKEEKRKGKS